MGFVVHTSAFTAHRSAMPGKLWFPRNRGTNMPENAHFRIEQACREYPLGWVLFRLSGVGDPVGFVVHTSAFTAHRSASSGKTLVSLKF